MKYYLPKNIKRKISINKSIIFFWKNFLIQGVFFLVTLVVVVLAAFGLNNIEAGKKTYLPATSWQDIVLYLLLITVVIIFFLLYKKSNKLKKFLYKALLIVFMLWGGMTILNLFLPVFVAVLVLGISILFWLNNPTILMHNILMILGISGTSVFFGLNLNASLIILLFLILSILDFVTYYKDKYLSIIIKEMIEVKNIFGFIIPKEAINLKNKISNIRIGVNYYIFWGNEVFLPGLLVASVITTGFLKSLLIVCFSLLGLIINYWVSNRGVEKAEVIPNFPVIALFSIIGYAIGLII